MHTRFLRTIVAAGLVAVSLPITAHAQNRYIGKGQALDVNASVLNLVGVEIASSVAGPQPTAGGSFSVGPEARAGSVSAAGVTAPLSTFGLTNFLSVNATALGATSVGAGQQVFSTATVATTGVNTPGTNLTLGLSAPGVIGGRPAVNLSSFLTLKAIRTETLATIFGVRTSHTIIEGLAIRDGNGAFVSVANSVLGLGATGSTLLDGSSNLDFDENDSVAGFSVAGVAGGNVLATVLLHEKLNDSEGTRTTNGIHVTLQSGALGANLVGADVVIASSSAGIAPEPGSVALMGVASLPLFGLLRRRRRAV